MTDTPVEISARDAYSLKKSTWFAKPFTNMEIICEQGGHGAFEPHFKVIKIAQKLFF